MIIYSSSLDASSEPPYSPGSCGSDDNKLPFHYLFLDSSILKNILSLIGCLPNMSHSGTRALQQHSKKKGLANCLEIKCTAAGCNLFYSTYTSIRVSKTNQAGLH